MNLNGCWRALALPLLLSPLIPAPRAADDLPVIPVGLDAYRLWEQWPYQRIGVRAYMRSTYDRRGGNEGADASHFLYQEADDFNVALDVQGPGVLYFARSNHWHGSPWHYEVDGRDFLVRESSTADPEHPDLHSVFLPEAPCPPPLTWTWSMTKGADLMWVPIPFERSFRMAYFRTHYGTGYYIYHQYIRGTPLSRPLRAWDGQSAPEADVLALIDRAGTDLVPRPDTPEGRRAEIQAASGTIRLPAKTTLSVAQLTNAPAMIRALEFFVPRDLTAGRSAVRLRLQFTPLPRPLFPGQPVPELACLD